jgi:hypothetical protein
MKNVTLSVVSVALTIFATASAAFATLTPFTPVAGINPAAGAIKVVITEVGITSQTLVANSGLSCSGTTCTITTTNGSCPLPGGGTAACRQVGGFDIFPMGTTGQVVLLTQTNTDSVQVKNLRVVNRGTATQLIIEASGNISANVETTSKAHGMKLVGTFYRTVSQTDGSKVAATAQSVLTLPASRADLTASFVYLKNLSTCTTNPVPTSTTCQGGRTNYATAFHLVSAGSLSNNSIKLGVPILILDSGTPSSTTCANAFSAGADCLDVDHTRVKVTFTLAKPTTGISTNTTLKCTKPPCSSVDFVELVASAAGYSGVTEEIVFLGTGLQTEAQQSLKPTDQGFFTIQALGTEDLDTSTCNCFDFVDSNGNLIPGVTFSPGKIDPDTLQEVPAKAVSCTRHGEDTNFKFDTPDTGFACSDTPAASYVVKAYCIVNVTSQETTSGRGNTIITRNFSGPVQGIVNGEGQIPITPCK